jgi:hypothetical protein
MGPPVKIRILELRAVEGISSVKQQIGTVAFLQLAQQAMTRLISESGQKAKY